MRGNSLLSRVMGLAAAAIVLLGLTGCRDAGDGLLLHDRFGNPDSGWGSEHRYEFDRGYQDGEYFIEVYEPNWLTWATPGERFTNVAVEIDARFVSGSPDGHFGLLCRYRAPNNFYYFAITGDGYYAILRVRDGRPSLLTDDGFLPSPSIYTDGRVNYMRAVCREDLLMLIVNDDELAMVSDTTFTRGDVGLAVGSGQQDGIRVHFDNIVVTVPDTPTGARSNTGKGTE